MERKFSPSYSALSGFDRAQHGRVLHLQANQTDYPSSLLIESGKIKAETEGEVQEISGRGVIAPAVWMPAAHIDLRFQVIRWSSCGLRDTPFFDPSPNSGSVVAAV